MKFIILLLCCFMYSTAAEEQNRTYRNALGWNNGISYRRHLKDGFFIGMSLRGSTSKSYDQIDMSTIQSGEEEKSDRTKVERTGISYNTSVTCQMGKLITQHRWLAIRFLIYPEYQYRWNDSWGTASQNRWYWTFSAGGFIGFEPSFTVLQRFTFGTRFGLHGMYSWSKHSDLSATETRDETGNRYEVQTLGSDLSAAMRLFGYYEF